MIIGSGRIEGAAEEGTVSLGSFCRRRLQRPAEAGGRFVVFGLLLIVVLAVPAPIAALSVRVSIVSHLGAGAARLTLYTNSAGSLYVNLKNLASGAWSEQVWSGTCASPGHRIVVLPELTVPVTGRAARTNALTAAQARGRSVRIARQSTVLCAGFDPAPVEDPGATGTPTAFFVAPTGSDGNPGTAASPWRSLQKAANSARPGAIVNVLSGTYSGFEMTRSGTSSAPIVFKGASGSRPVIAGDGRRATVVLFNGAHDVALVGFDVSGAAGPRETGAGIRTESGAHDIRIADNVIHHNSTQGINISNSTRITVAGNDVHHNEIGIQVTDAGTGVQIVNNDVHDNDRMVRNTEAPDDDYGGVGIAFVRSTGNVSVRDNRLSRNRAPSHDYGWDGGAFEIFGASNVTMSDNTMWDNETVLETGTSGTDCADNVFVRNVAYGSTTAGHSLGILLRCAERMRIVNNTFYRLDLWVFSLGPVSDKFGSTIDGLQIVNNIAVMNSGEIYGIQMALSPSVVIDHNLVYNSSGGRLATVAGRGVAKQIVDLRSWIGQELNGVSADPRFANPAGLDFRLTSDSPAIDRGVVVPGITETFEGVAPDLGRDEPTPVPRT